MTQLNPSENSLRLIKWAIQSPGGLDGQIDATLLEISALLPKVPTTRRSTPGASSASRSASRGTGLA